MSNHEMTLEGGSAALQDEPVGHEKWPLRLKEILDELEADLRTDHTPEQARALARRCVIAVAEVGGGHPQYLPRGDSLRQAWRNESLYAQFRGNNYYELAKESHLSESQVRKIIELLRRMDVARRQRPLL